VATAYLLKDADIRRFCVTNPVKMIVAPGLLLAFGMAIFSRPGSVFTAALLVLSLYQAWHFGAQNIGVAAFVSLADRGKSLSRWERTAIKLGIVIGLLGVLRAMSPDFIVGAQYMPLSDTVLAALEMLYRIGIWLAPPVVAAALYFAVSAWRSGHPMFGLTIFLSITFLFPIYLSRNYVIGFMSFVVAHGLQYLVFLATHSATRQDRSRGWVTVASAPVALLVVMLVGNLIRIDIQPVGSASFATLGIAIVMSLTLVHFWVDRFVWRMKDRERAAWIKQSFATVIQFRHSR